MPYDPIESEESEEQEEAPPPKRRKQQHRRQIEAAVETPEELEEEVEHGSMQMQADRRSAHISKHLQVKKTGRVNDEMEQIFSRAHERVTQDAKSSKDLDTLHDWLVAELNAEAARPAPALADITASLEQIKQTIGSQVGSHMEHGITDPLRNLPDCKRVVPHRDMQKLQRRIGEMARASIAELEGVPSVGPQLAELLGAMEAFFAE